MSEFFETLRGGLLMLARWFIDYPIVYGTYRVRGLTRAPFLMQSQLGEKPGILVSNYGNYFFDDMIGSMISPVWPFVFSRDTVCRLYVMNWILRFFRHIPIIRSTDAKYSTEERHARNEKAFARAAGLLQKGHWFTVFPEVQPGHRAKLLTPLKPGAAHIALRAEAGAGWKLGLRIYVYGTNYENKFVGRSNLYIRWATPIEVAKFREAYEANPKGAEELLMQEIEKALHGCVLEAPATEYLALAHRLAFQRRDQGFSGVQQALSEVVSGSSNPEDMRRIVCRRGRESAIYQVLGYALWGVGFVLRWPFRTFGRLCAAEPSEEMTYMFIFWLLVLVVGTYAGESSRWAKIQLIDTWFAMTMWLWAWRRGVINQ